MRIVRSGITRTVFILKNVVIKVPTLRNGFYFFCRGICANNEEARTYRAILRSSLDEPNTNVALLAEVKWCSWGGMILVMERVDTERLITHLRRRNKEEDFNAYLFDHITKSHKRHFRGDDKPENYGYTKDGRLVKIDYPDNPHCGMS